MKQKKPNPAAGKPAGKSKKPTRRTGETKRTAPPASAETAEARWVNMALIRAIRERASEIRIGPTRTGLAVRFRVGGVLHSASGTTAISARAGHSTPPPDVLRTFANIAQRKDLAPAIVARLRAMSRISSAGKRARQNGRYRAIVDGREVDFRISISPATYGESVTIRVLDPARRD